MIKIIYFLLATSIFGQVLLLDDIKEYNQNKTLTFSYINSLNNWDFTSGFTPSGATIIDNNSFSTAGSGGIYKTLSLSNGSVYNTIITASTTGSNIRVFNTASTVTLVPSSPTPINANTIVLYNSTNYNIMINNLAAGTVDVSQYSIKKLVPPNNFSSTISDASNYVIEATGGGCEFHEVTGITYIQMSDTLKAGYYTVKTLQDWTQGKLYLYNGVATYYLPQADVYYSVKVYADGTHPLSIQCDNNTISNLKLLSVKK